MVSVVVIILTLNQRDRTLSCLGSLLETEQNSFRVLVWDNGSSDGTEQAIVKRFPQVTVHHNATNLGVASGRNAAAKLRRQRIVDNDLLARSFTLIVVGLFRKLLIADILSDSIPWDVFELTVY